MSGDKISDVKSSSMASEQLISLLWSLASRRQSAHFRKPHITKLMALVPWAPLIATFISHDFIFILTIGVFTSFETAFCHVAQAVRKLETSPCLSLSNALCAVSEGLLLVSVRNVS